METPAADSRRFCSGSRVREWGTERDSASSNCRERREGVMEEVDSCFWWGEGEGRAAVVGVVDVVRGGWGEAGRGILRGENVELGLVMVDDMGDFWSEGRGEMRDMLEDDCCIEGRGRGLRP